MPLLAGGFKLNHDCYPFPRTTIIDTLKNILRKPRDNFQRNPNVLNTSHVISVVPRGVAGPCEIIKLLSAVCGAGVP